MTPEQKAKKAAYMKRYRSMRKVAETPERRAQKAEYMRRYRLTEKGRAYFHRYERSEARKTVNRRKELLRTYGLTIEEYDAMLISQSNGCAICGAGTAGNRRLHVDHDHITGKTRGLLCGRHNVAVSYIEAADLPAVIAYVEKWKAAHSAMPIKE
jgi:hypothetical protein